MCDERTTAEDEVYLRGKGEVSRRTLGIGAISAAALAACATKPANAKAVIERDVAIKTPDGICDAHFVHPGSGAHSGVLVWPDAFGLRSSFKAMGKRLAESGYAVLTINQFYRAKPAPVLPAGASFGDPEIRKQMMGLMGGLNPQTNAMDAAAFVDWLDAQPEVDKNRKIGVTGYCMGGPLTIRTAAAKPDRIGAAASFHGGGLATDKPESPHLLIPQTKASYLIAIAQNDDEKEPTVKDTLRAAFDAAKRPAEIDVYPAQHGWCSLDHPVYDQVQADKAWARLLALFEKNLG